MLISGADPTAPNAGVPALAGANRARYVDFDSGHFVMLVRSDDMERTIHDWIADLP